MEMKRSEHPICPHCGKEDRDWYELIGLKHDGDIAEIECCSCDKLYWVALQVSYSFMCWKPGPVGVGG